MIKLIAIGNTFMGDDGIALKVLERIEDELSQFKQEIDVIYGETDFIYCLNKINDKDLVIILDSTYLGGAVGKVRVFTLKETYELIKRPHFQHELSLIYLLEEFKDVEGYVIGIEVCEVNYSEDISAVMQSKLTGICNEVIKWIKMLCMKYL